MVGFLVFWFLVGSASILFFYIVKNLHWISALRNSWESIGRQKLEQSTPLDSDEDDLLESLGYETGEKLGEGSYAVVKKAYSKNMEKEIAIKIVASDETDKNGNKDKFLKREIEILRWLSHPNIIRLFEVIEGANHLFIVMELASNGDLLTLLQKRGKLKEDETRRMFKCIMRGVLHCHKKGITHRDLKLENILLSEDNQPIVTDFGFARYVGSTEGKRTRSRTFCGSYAYVAPEILQGIPYDGMASDVWSLGVVLFTMVCGRFPFDDSDTKVLLQQTTSGKLEYPAGAISLSAGVKDLISKMLSPDVNLRITLKEAMDHQWITLAQNPSSS